VTAVPLDAVSAKCTLEPFGGTAICAAEDVGRKAGASRSSATASPQSRTKKRRCIGSAALTSFDTTAGDSSRASPPGASSFSAARFVSETYRTHEVDWIERVETFHDAESLGRVAMIVAIDFEETEPVSTQAHAPSCAIARLLRSMARPKSPTSAKAAPSKAIGSPMIFRPRRRVDASGKARIVPPKSVRFER
jgi:hypothetical protein